MATARDAELIAIALNNFITDGGDAFDNIFARNAVVRYFMEKDLKGDGSLQRVKFLDGGLNVEHPLEYAEGGTTATFDGLDIITFAPKEIFTNSIWEWKHVVATLVLDNKEILKVKNNMKKLADYVGARLRNTQKGLRKNLNTQMVALTPGAKDFISFPKIVQKDPTSVETIGGIAQGTAANAFWRNQKDESAATTWELLVQEIQSLRITCADNAQDDQPDLMLTDQIVYEYMLNYMRAKGVHAFDEHMSKVLDYDVLKVQGMALLYDTNVPNMHGSGTFSSIFLLNTDYLRINVHQDRQFELSKDIDLLAGQGQDATGWAVFLMACISCANRKKQGLEYKISRTITA